MSETHLVFQAGQNEGIDPKVLPDGMWAVMKNARIRHDGKLECRYAYQAQVGAPAGVLNSVRSFAHNSQQLLTMAPRTSSANATIKSQVGTTWPNVISSSPTMFPTYGEIFEGVTRAQMCGAADWMTSCDCIYSPDGYLWGVVSLYTAGTATLYRYDPVSKEKLGSWALTGDATTPASECKLLLVGSTVVCVYALADQTVRHFAINTSTLVTTDVLIRSAYATHKHERCDAIGYLSNAYLFVIVSSDGKHFSLKSVSAGGTISSLGDVDTPQVTDDREWQISLAYNPLAGRLGICCRKYPFGSDANNGYVYFVKVNLSTVTIDSTVTVDTGPTGGTPVCGFDTLSNQFCCVTSHSWGAKLWYEAPLQYTLPGVSVVSRPTFSGNAMHFWVENIPGISASVRRPTTYYLVTHSAATSGYPTVDAVSARLQGYETSSNYAPRRNVAVKAGSAGAYAETTALPIYGSLAYHAVDFISVDYDQLPDVGRPVSINGQSIVPGALLREWDGSQLVESALADGPRRCSASSITSGHVTAGDHIYAATWEWRDASGRRHQSAPTFGSIITVAVGGEVINVTVDGPSFSSKTDLSASIYRTAAGGTVYYFVGSMAVSAGSATGFVFTDDLTDAEIAVNQTLYTQGQLPHDAPPAARYACADATRVLLGGLEDPTRVQWSKLVFNGEPVQWSAAENFTANVDAPVTGVAVLEGTWVIFTESSVWEVSGDGPDENGAGFFPAARKRPSLTGCISQRSIVEYEGGILFQGTNGGMWMLPRGGNAPEWIGQPVRDTLAAYPTITSACHVPSENCIYWTCVNSTAGVLLVYDTRLGTWYVDSVRARRTKSLALYQSKLVLDGLLAQAPADIIDVDEAGSLAIVPEVETGDIRPFGAGGWGRVRLIHVMGASPSGSNPLTVKISYDSGATWTDTFTWASYATGVGTVDVQCGPSLIRGVSYRLNIKPSPGLTLTSISFDLYPSSGLKRAANADRR